MAGDWDLCADSRIHIHKAVAFIVVYKGCAVLVKQPLRYANVTRSTVTLDQILSLDDRGNADDNRITASWIWNV